MREPWVLAGHLARRPGVPGDTACPWIHARGTPAGEAGRPRGFEPDELDGGLRIGGAPGVDIDPRVAQIASLALWMRARRACREPGVPPADRPAIRRTRVVSRTGFFLSSFQEWREEILIEEAPPVVFADLGCGLLDDARVQVAACCLEVAP